VCSVRPLYWLKCVTCSVFGFWVLLSGELLLPAFTIYGDFIRVLVSCLWLQLESTSWQKEVGEVAKTLQTHIYYISSIYILCMSSLFWRSPNFWALSVNVICLRFLLECDRQKSGERGFCGPQLELESGQWERDWNYHHECRNSAYSLCRNLSGLKRASVREFKAYVL